MRTQTPQVRFYPPPCPDCGVVHTAGTRHRVSFAQQQERAKAQAIIRQAELVATDPIGYRTHQWVVTQAGRGIPADAEASEYASVLLRDICSYCNTRTNRPAIDHITPRSAGGLTTTDNLTATCLSCNSIKRSKPMLVGFARVIDRLVTATEVPQ